MPSESGKPLIVISYAHADEPETPAEGEVKWLSFVTGYLRPAIKHGAADLWLDRLMPGGADWEREIGAKLRACDVFILLVSRFSMGSDYVVDKEIKIIRERQAKGDSVHFYPLVLTPTPMAGLDVVRDKNLRPRDGTPLSDYPLHERYRHMNEAADEIAAFAAKSAERLAASESHKTLEKEKIVEGSETARLEGHTRAVQALCLMPDGRLASGSSDNTIRLWDLATGVETARLEGHMGEVQALYLMPDGRLASGSSDNTIRLWDLATGAETARLEGHTGAVQALCLMPDGRLASGSSDNTINLWNVATGAETLLLEGHTGAVQALCLMPDGRLASGSSDNTIGLWNMATGAGNARLEGHTGAVQALCLMPDGRLASGSSDNTIRLWDLATGVETARLEGRIGGPVQALCVLPDGRLAWGSGRLGLWNVATAPHLTRLEGHSGPVEALCLLPDGRLASGSWDSTIRLWNVATVAETTRLYETHAKQELPASLPDLDAPFAYAWTASQRVAEVAGGQNLPFYPHFSSEEDHRGALEAARVGGERLLKALRGGRYNARPEYGEALEYYLDDLPKTAGAGNILLANDRIRILHDMFLADAAGLPVGLASGLKSVIANQFAVNAFYDLVQRHNEAVNTGNWAQPFPLDAAKGFFGVVEDNTPRWFEPGVEKGLRQVEQAEPPAAATQETASSSDIEPPPLPPGTPDAQDSWKRQMATAANALWETFLQGRDMPVAQDEWRAAAEELGVHVRPVIEFLRAQDEGK